MCGINGKIKLDMEQVLENEITLMNDALIHRGPDDSGKMKILHIIDHMGVGGAQTILKGIFEAGKCNENIFCYALRYNKNEVGIDHPDFCSYKGNSKLNIKSLFELRTLIGIEKIECVHCHLVKSMLFGYLVKLLFFKNIKLVFHEHGRIFQKQNLYNYFLRKTQYNVDLYIAVSTATKNKLIKNANINPNKIEILYNFVDLEKFNPSQIKKVDRIKNRKKIGLTEMDFVIGFAGRLNKIKGCDILIKSVPHINIKNFKLMVAGDGVERNRLEKLAYSLNIENNLIFLGYVKDVVQFYSLIDCLVVPSRSESFGLSVVEAQALGVPVIASNIKGLNEVVLDKKTGLLFESGNENDLAEKIELIYSDEILRMELTKNGLDNVKKYSLDNYLITLWKIYENY